MKKVYIGYLTCSALLFACGNENSSGTTTQSDSSSHSGSHSATTTPSDTDQSTNSNSATTSGSNASMMDLMNKNMQDMKAIKSTGNLDNDFAALMKVHHMGALEMAQVEAAQGQDAQMKQIAQKMIDAQQSEIVELNTFLSGHQAHGGGESFYNDVMSQMNNMKMEHSGSIDKQFVQMMIPHHQGAIDMARAYLKSGAHEEKLKTMANKIITDQQKEIRELQAWLAKNK